MLKHDWTNAAHYAQVVMTNFPVLNTKEHILQGFSDINLPDVVFGCDITNDNSGNYRSFFSQMDMFGSGYAAIGVWRAGFKPTIDRISNTDIRLDWFIDTARNGAKLADEFGMTDEYTAEAWPDVNYQSVKFIGGGRANVPDGTGYCEGWQLGDYIYLRSEEAYLIKAEALAHQGKSEEAITILNTFMQTRDPQYSYNFTDKAALIEEINFQKSIEFWGEGIEYLDNRRLNIPVDRTDETWSASNNNHYYEGKIKLTQDAHNFVYQIPDYVNDSKEATEPVPDEDIFN